MEKREFTAVGASVRKKDAEQLLLGRPVYTDDILTDSPLTVRLLRSRHANAIVESIDTAAAKKVPGVVAIYTWEDVPANRFSIAGQTYPEPSPYDRLILDRHVRYNGDPVAIVAAETEKAASKALSLIRVKYTVLEAITDLRKAKDNALLVHPEEDWSTVAPFFGGDPKRNLVASCSTGQNDVDAVLADCDIVLDRTYHTKAFNQVPMETFCTYTHMDTYGRLHVISSTQIVFHVRRILSTALSLPMSRICVEKPRIGGGFGAKQTAISELYPAFVTMKTGRSAELIFSRNESIYAGSPRHEMELHVRLGADRDGRIRAIDLHTLSNTGAYGEHGPTTVSLSGNKTISLYTGSLEAYRFSSDVVYTNLTPSGAYRGYGATQGFYALESAVNELSDVLHMDPTVLRERNMVRTGMAMHPLGNEITRSCALDKCMVQCRDLFRWEEKYPVRDMGNGKLRAAGMAMAMQGSCIAGIDVGSATLKLTEDGSYSLLLGCADMGTGCDTILAQMAAEALQCPVDCIAVMDGCTDTCPYDSGSYASSTTYLTGNAVREAAAALIGQMKKLGACILKCETEDVEFTGQGVTAADGRSASLKEIGMASQCSNDIPASATATCTSPLSPPPFMVGMAEIELDTATGLVRVLDYTAVVDCGTPVNPALARIQAEGGIVQGIGHTLTENIHYTPAGRVMQSSLMEYKIPTRQDFGSIRVEFVDSYEVSGPYGAKSIGELVINPVAPAISHAIARAVGHSFREIPITPEQIVRAWKKEGL